MKMLSIELPIFCKCIFTFFQLANANHTYNETSAVSAEKSHKIKDLEKHLAESEHERKLLQERLDAARGAAADTKRQAHGLSEQLQHVQHTLAEQEVRKMEIEGQLRSANVILKQKQENEDEILHRIQEIQEVRSPYFLK